MVAVLPPAELSLTAAAYVRRQRPVYAGRGGTVPAPVSRCYAGGRPDHEITAMKLYGYYRSSAAYRIRIILNFKGIVWEYQPVGLHRGEQHGAGFRAVNPMGLVPVLADGDVRLSQSPAIAEYLEEQYPSPPLMPRDPALRGQVRETQHLIGCDIHPLQNLRVLNHLRSTFAQDDAGVEAWCRHWIAAGLTAVEKLAADRSTQGRFCIGDQASLADVWLIPQLYNARRFGLGLDPFPVIAGIDGHCATLEAVAAAHPAKQADAPAP